MKLTKEEILNDTEGGLAVLKYYLNKNYCVENFKNFNAVFRVDKTPSATIFFNEKYDRWYYKDYGGELDKLDAFGFVMKMAECEFMEAIEIITDDYNSIIEYLTISNIETKMDTNLNHPMPAKFIHAESTNKSEYWYQFGDRSSIDEVLTKFKVKDLKFYIKQNGFQVRKSSIDGPIFAFGIDEGYKIYRPFYTKLKHSWVNTPQNYRGLFGLEQLPNKCKTIIITEGLKDCIVANANLNYFDCYAVGLDNASTKLFNDDVEHLKSICDNNLYFCLDTDKTGVNAAKKLSSKHQIPWVDISCLFDQDVGKDIADYFINPDSEAGTLHIVINKSKDNIITEELAQKTNNNIMYPNFKKIGKEIEIIDPDILFKTQYELKERIKNHIEPPKPLIYHGDNAIIYPNTINIIQGQTGTHKSRLAEAICSMLLSPNSDNPVHLTFNCKDWNKDNIVVCYIDTERNLNDQFPLALQRIMFHAGYTEYGDEISNFEYTSLLPVTRKSRTKHLSNYLEKIQSKHNKHLLVVCDVITDFVTDFNNATESLILIDKINIDINKSNMTSLVVIHENPNSSKARGHLGTELSNKTSTIFQISTEDESDDEAETVYKVRYLKCRNSKRYKPFHVKYNNGLGGLVLTDYKPLNIKEVEFEKWTDVICTYLIANEEGVSNTELNIILTNEFGKSEKTNVKKISELLMLESFSYNGLDLKIIKTTQGKQVFYKIVEVK